MRFHHRLPRHALCGLGLAAAVALGGATAVSAQAPAPPALAAPRPLAPPPGNAPPQRAPAPGYEAQADPWAGYRQEYLQDYFTYLRNTLRISDAQRPAWNRFEDTVRANMQARQAERPQPRDPRAGPPPLPERLDRRMARLEAEHDRIAAIAAAVRPLYATFSEEQRRIADVELAPGRIMGGPRPALTMRDRMRNRRPFGRL